MRSIAISYIGPSAIAVADQLELETDGKRNEFADLWDFRLPKEVDLSVRGVERYVDALAGEHLTHDSLRCNFSIVLLPKDGTKYPTIVARNRPTHYEFLRIGGTFMVKNGIMFHG